MVTDNARSNSISRPVEGFGPAFRKFLVRLLAALLVAGLLLTLAALIGGFWSYVCTGGAFVILGLIGMDATIRRGEFIRRAGPLPIRRDRKVGSSERQTS